MNPSSRLRAILKDPLNLVALAVGLIWGAVALFGRPIGDFGVETDFYGDFARYAREWMHGQPSLMNGFRGPGYYLVLGVVSLPLGDAFLAGKLISVISAAFGIRIAGGVIRHFLGTTAAVAGSLFIAANPVFIEYAYRAGSDHFFWLLFVGAVALLVIPGTRPDRRWLLAGAVAGMAYLTRYNGAALVPAALGAAVIAQRPWSTAFRRAALFLAAFVVVIGPWALYLWVQTGNPLWNNNYQNVAIEVLAGKPGLAQQGNFMGAVGFRSIFDVIRVAPDLFFGTMLTNLVVHAREDVRQLVGIPWAIAALAGFAVTARTWLTRPRLAFAAMALVTYALLLAVFYNPRFMLPLLLWWGAAVGGLALFLAERLRPHFKTAGPRRQERRRRKKKGEDASGAASGAETPRAGPAPAGSRAPLVVGLLFAAAASITTVQGIRLSQDAQRHGGIPVEYLDLARAVKRAGLVIDENTPIIARKPHVGYVLGAPVMPLPEGNLEQMRRKGAHYLLVSGIEVALYPALTRLWNPPRNPADVPPGVRFVAYGMHEVPQGTRVATLYAFDNPIPYTSPVPGSPRSDPPALPPGMSRVDLLRLQLAEWWMQWNADPDPEAMLARIGPPASETARVLIPRGDAAMERGDPEDAEARYRAALEADPDNGRALLSLAGALARQENTEGMHEALARYARRANYPDPVPAGAWREVAQAMMNSRLHSAALAPLLRAREIEPENADILKKLTYAYIELRRNAEAKELLARYQAAQPNDPEGDALKETIRQLEP